MASADLHTGSDGLPESWEPIFQNVIEEFTNPAKSMQRRVRELYRNRMEQALKLGAKIEFGQAEDIQSSILHGAEHARILFERNQMRYMGPEIAATILKACQTGETAAFKKMRSIIGMDGALIEKTELEEFERRLTDPLWVIGSTSAKHPDPQSVYAEESTEVADCQCVLPPDNNTVPQPEFLQALSQSSRAEGKRPHQILDLPMLEKLLVADPASIGYIDQMCVHPDFNHLKVGAAARYAAFQRVKTISQNREHPINHLIGWVFCIQGVEVIHEGQSEIHLLDAHSMDSIVNMISLIVNENSTRCPGVAFGRVQDYKVPVIFEVDGNTYTGNLCIDRYLIAHTMDRIS